MSERPSRTLPVVRGRVQCTPKQAVTVERCRFCVHSTHFQVGGERTLSPARAYCMLKRAVQTIDLDAVEAVVCDDSSGEGYRSIMNVIS